MKRKGTIGRLGCAVCLTAALIGGGLGCQPASNSGRGPVTTQPAKQPQNKEQPAKQPKPDVGSLHPFGPSFAKVS